MVTRALDLTNRDDLAYIEALADTCGTLSDRNDMAVAPLSEFWRSVLKGLIAQLKLVRST